MLQSAAAEKVELRGQTQALQSVLASTAANLEEAEHAAVAKVQAVEGELQDSVEHIQSLEARLTEISSAQHDEVLIAQQGVSLERIKSLETALREKDEEIESLDQELLQEQLATDRTSLEHIAIMRATLLDKNAAVGRLHEHQNHSTQLTEQIATLEDQLEARTTTEVLNEGQKTSLDERIKSLEASLSPKSDRIERLQEERNHSSKMLREQARLHESEALLVLTRQTRGREAQLNMAQLLADLARAEEQTEQQAERIATLEIDLDAKEAANARLLVTSLSHVSLSFLSHLDLSH